MSLKEIKQVKRNKYFTRWDLIVYLILFALVVVTAVVVALSASREAKPKYLEIRYRNNLIGLYDFEKNALTTEDGYESFFETEEQSGEVMVYIYLLEEEYNVLRINVSARTADMEDSNCSRSKDCTYMHLKRAGQTIVCVPHNLVIKGVSQRVPNEDIVIG